eukprot:TRINITY_DN11276_c0_g4_i1.p1 TRINITY_DN11276_c0_g4~~TRINITY_DN11276_c0_g4_i1.p1  ORF type:complete len:186 (-),score=26.32 TRINITY_DN11276_c0_g4_i1:246-803(-)
MLKRKPLSDCTNTPPTNISHKSKPQPQSLTVKPLHKDPIVYESSTGSNTFENPNNPRRSRLSFTTPQLKTSANSDAVVCDNSEHLRIYSRRSVEEKKNKGKAVAAVIPSSCPPVGRTRDQLKEHEDVDLSKTCRRQKRKKIRRTVLKDVGSHGMSQDYIDRQRAYFAEIDAFQLQEEVVSASEQE